MKILSSFYNECLNKEGRKRTLLLLMLNKITSLIEIFSVFSIFPLLFVALDGNFNTLNNENLKFIFQFIENNFGQNDFLFFVILILIIFFIKFIFTTVTGYLIIKFNNNFIYELSAKLYKNYIRINLANRVNSNTSKYFNVIERFSEESVTLYFISYISLIKSIFTILLVVIGLIFVDFTITLIAIIFYSFLVLLYILFTKNINYNLGFKKVLYLEKLTKNINEAFNSLRELKIYNLENFFVNNFKENKFKYIHNKTLGTFLNQFSKFSAEIILIVSFILMIYILKLTDRNNQEIIITLGFLVFASSKLIPQFLYIIKLVNNIHKGRASTEKILHELENMLGEKKVFLNINQNSSENINFRKNFNLKQISFKHLNSDNFILKKLDLSFKKGEWITIAGESGIGKSTLLDLMIGFNKLTEGKIFIDDKEINVFEKQSWYRNISVVSQDTFIFEDSLCKNITLNDIKDLNEQKRKQYLEVIKICRIDDFIKKEDYFSSRSLGERGQLFSSGQKQRISLARGLYKKPQILFLDEALNALDKDLEIQVYEELKKLQPLITIISISHNKTINNYSDKIYELKNKKLLQ